MLFTRFSVLESSSTVCVPGEMAANPHMKEANELASLLVLMTHHDCSNPECEVL